MKAIRITLSLVLTAISYMSMAQGVIIYKSNGTQEKLPYTAIDSIIPYAGDKTPVSLPEPKYVDLGLPSGTLWADRNLGASAPEGIGGYYAWGETDEKTRYTWNTYLCSSKNACATDSDPIYADGLITVQTAWDYITGYSGNIAGTKYDVASKNWGTAWAMPTKEQLDELINYCTSKKEYINGTNCWEYTGPNGNSIIIPTVGGYKDDQSTKEADGRCYLWTSTIHSNFNYAAFYGQNTWVSTLWASYMERCYGMQVRPICVDKSAVDNKGAAD